MTLRSAAGQRKGGDRGRPARVPDGHLLARGEDAGHACGRSRARRFGDTSTTTRAEKAWKDAKLERLGRHGRTPFASPMIAAGIERQSAQHLHGPRHHLDNP
jgi:hypothetical protein